MESQLTKTQAKETIKIFFCCAYDIYNDIKIVDELIKHLHPLKRQGRIQYWHGRMISPGNETIHEIDNYLASADIILLMISPDFISSDYCDYQMRQALERQQVDEVHVIPVIFRPVEWKNTLFGMLQPLPTNGKPITTWSNRDEALLEVANGIQQIIDEVSKNVSSKESSSSGYLNYDKNRPIYFPNITLIDASLDPHDSPYKENIENNKKTIQFKNHILDQNTEKLNVERIIEQEPMHYQIYRYRFPTIDFKFTNSGNSTALLWKFAINILQSEIDTKPTFSFRIQVEDNVLEIIAINNGWGEAYNCHIYIDEPILNLLFTEINRRYTGTIASGEERKIFSFSKENANEEQFEAITKEFTEVPHHYPKTIRGIKLNALVTKWTCTDDKGVTCEGKEQIKSFDRMGEYLLTYNGFFKNDFWRAGGGAPSELTYSTIIDPLEGSHEQYYSISRKIPPGDIERFHIMVGAAKSCHLLIQFKIYVNKTNIIESEIFDINIWNPRNSGWHNGYKDGEELKRDLEKQQNRINSDQISNRDKKPEQSFLNLLSTFASNYPFLKDLRQRRGWLLDE